MKIRRAAVLGAGVMGAQIAAHLANAGISSLLLDIVPPDDPEARNKLAEMGLEKARKAKPAAFFQSDLARLITAGNFEDDLTKLEQVDWILEAVVERLDAKRALLEKVEAHRRPGTLVSTNTSGLLVREIAAGHSEEFRRHWMGTHFFNPPRYMKLVEVIPTPDTSREALSRMSDFCDRVLGKGVVLAKDTPNFIANRIGTFAVLYTLHVMSKDGYSIEEADLLTGPVLGRPRTATFRTADLVGLDTFLHVCRNLYENLPLDEYRELFQPPPVLTELVSRGWLGDKSGQGFYRRAKGGEGSALLALDLKTLEYRPAEKPKFASLEMTRGIEDLDERLPALVFQEDRAGQFLWSVLSETLVYAANRIPEIADNIVDVDRALRWGFNWERGPFEIWDALGARKIVERLEKEDRPVSPLALQLLRAGKKSFHERREGTRYFFSPAVSGYEAVAEPAGVILLDELRHQGRVVRENAGASLLDLGDGVACLEFRSKMNAIGGDTIEMLRAALEVVDKEFEGLVVGNQGPHFSAGANLMLLLLEAQEGNWDEIDFMIRVFQGANTALRYFQKPIVAAPFGMTLGGGCEVSLHCHRLQASAEVYMGLVEVGVGLIPAGGGTKEMLARAMEADAVRRDPNADLLPYLKSVFETIGMAKVSSSASEARELGFLREEDGITFNPDRLIADAKQAVLSMAPAFRPPQPRREILVMGNTALAAMKLALHLMKRAGYISEYDEVIGLKLAHVLAGGNLHAPRKVSEQYLLDLERGAFLSLIGQRKTQERIQHMLKTGKALRN